MKQNDKVNNNRINLNKLVKTRDKNKNKNKNKNKGRTKITENRNNEKKIVIPSPDSNWLQVKNQLQINQNKFSSFLKTDNNNNNIKLEKRKNIGLVSIHKREKEKRIRLTKDKEETEFIKSLQDKIVCMDCEMVGVGLNGLRSVLARVSIVSFDKEIIYDKYVQSHERITDFRTKVSGIRAKHLKTAIPFLQCQKEVGDVLKNKILVGHSLKNDFKALMFSHPPHLIRDTAKFRPYMRRKINGTRLYPRSLKDLTKHFLNREIQTGEHNSIEDAIAALDLYKREMVTWESLVSKTKSINFKTLFGNFPTSVNKMSTIDKTKNPGKKADIQNHLGIMTADDDDAISSQKINKVQFPTQKNNIFLENNDNGLSNLEYDITD